MANIIYLIHYLIVAFKSCASKAINSINLKKLALVRRSKVCSLFFFLFRLFVHSNVQVYFDEAEKVYLKF